MSQSSTSWPQIQWKATDPVSKKALHLLQSGKISEPAKPLEPEVNQTAYLQFTSGSTSDPKGVEVTHGNIYHNVLLQVECCNAEGVDTKTLFWVPAYHDMGLIGGMMFSLMMGSSGYNFSPITFIQNPLLWIELISRVGATHTGAPNFAYDLVVSRLEKESPDVVHNWDLSTLMHLFNGAEPVRESTILKFEAALAKYGLKPGAVRPCYGLAESTVLVATQFGPRLIVDDKKSVSKAEARNVSLGQPCLHGGMDVRIVDPETCKQLPDGTQGEVWLRGGSKGKGYFGLAEKSKETFEATIDGGDPKQTFLRTGDIGYMKQQCLYVLGRMKDVIIIRGRNYVASDIEYAVYDADSSIRPGCAAAFAIETVSGETGQPEEALCIVTEVRNAKISPQKQLETCNKIRGSVARLCDAEVSRIVLIAPRSICKTTSGKIQRALTKEACIGNGFGKALVHDGSFGDRMTTVPQPRHSIVAPLTPPPSNNNSPVVGRKSGRFSPDSGYGNSGDTTEATSASGSQEHLPLESDLRQRILNAGDHGQRLEIMTTELSKMFSREFEVVVKPDDNLGVATGMSSMQAANMVGNLSRQLSIRVPISIMFTYENLRDVSEAILNILETQPIRNDIPEEQPIPMVATLEDKGGLKLGVMQPTSDPTMYSRIASAKALVDMQHGMAAHKGIVYNRASAWGANSSVEYHLGEDESRNLISFANPMYLGLAKHPKVIQSLTKTAEQYGIQFGLYSIWMHLKPLEKLEGLLCQVSGAEECVVAPSLHIAHQVYMLSTIFEEDAIVMDANAHASLQLAVTIVASRGAVIRIVPHNDARAAIAAVRELSRSCRQVHYVCDGVYSMEGDVVPIALLEALLSIGPNVFIYADDAHGTSIDGERGEGYLLSRFPMRPRFICTLSLNKAFGSVGGALCLPSKDDKVRIRSCPTPLQFSGVIPPPYLEASCTIAEMHLSGEIHPMQEAFWQNVATFRKESRKLGLPVIWYDPDDRISQHFLLLGEEKIVRDVWKNVVQDGFFVSPVGFPAVAPGKAGLRVSINAAHRSEDIVGLVQSLGKHIPSALLEGRNAMLTQTRLRIEKERRDAEDIGSVVAEMAY